MTYSFLMICPLRASDVHSSTHPRAAKIRSVSVPQEYNLARLVESADKKHRTWDTNTPVCEWYGIECCEKKRVKAISWRFADLGSLNWKYLPPNLESLEVMKAHLRGELPLEMFPPSLVYIYLYYNKLTGNLVLLRLPPSLEVFDVQSNQFFGIVDFSLLPTGLSELTLSWNSDLKGAFDVGMCSPSLSYDVRRTNITVSNGCLFREV